MAEGAVLGSLTPDSSSACFRAYHQEMRRQRFILALLLGLSLALSSPPTRAADSSKESNEGAWLGAFLRDADDGGVELVAVVPGGPASSAGLTAGDVLLEFHGSRVLDIASFERLLHAARSGQQVRSVVLRDGKPIERKLHLAARPTGDGRFPSVVPGVSRMPESLVVRRPSFGWIVVDATPDLRRHFGAPADRGVLVSGVSGGGSAESLGLRVGDIVVQVDDVAVHSAQDVNALVRQARSRPATLHLVRDGKVERLELPPDRVAPDAPPSSEILPEKAIRAEIERLRRRLSELEEQLAALDQPAPGAR